MAKVPRLDDQLEVWIELAEDAMTPNIKCLMLVDEDGGYRLTGSKGCGQWERVRQFKCTLTLRDLMSYAKNKTKEEQSDNKKT